MQTSTPAAPYVPADHAAGPCTPELAAAIAAEFGIRRDISSDIEDANRYAAQGKNPSDPRDGTGAAGFLRCWFVQEVNDAECDSLAHADFCRDAYGDD
jgi:hypothetical protein